MSIRDVLDHRMICELEAHGDIETLARALRNVVKVTDDATSAAQAASRHSEDYVPTAIRKGDIYQAMDKALRGEELSRLAKPAPLLGEPPF